MEGGLGRRDSSDRDRFCRRSCLASLFFLSGGLGQRIHIAISLFFENQLLTLIIAIYILVTLVDYLSAYLRRKVI